MNSSEPTQETMPAKGDPVEIPIPMRERSLVTWGTSPSHGHTEDSTLVGLETAAGEPRLRLYHVVHSANFFIASSRSGDQCAGPSAHVEPSQRSYPYEPAQAYEVRESR